MPFVVETVLRIVTLCGALGPPLNGVIGFIFRGSSVDRYSWAAHRGFVPGTSASGYRSGVAGLLVLLGGLEFGFTWPLLFVCLWGRAVSLSADGEMLGNLGDGVFSGALSMGELYQEFPHVGEMLHGVVMWGRGICLRAATTAACPSRPGAMRP